MAGNELVLSDKIQKHIHTIRGLQVMMDSDLAELYQVEVKFLNRAVKRNFERFPPQYMFQLTAEETENLKSQIATSKEGDFLRYQFGTSNQRGGPPSRNRYGGTGEGWAEKRIFQTASEK